MKPFESRKDTPVYCWTCLFTLTASLILQNIFYSSDSWACIEARLQVCWTFLGGVFYVLGLDLALLAARFLVAWELCWSGYRSCSNCCWAWIASLLVVTWTCKFFFCCFIISINSSALARQPFLSKLVWNSLSNCTTGICGLSLYCKPYGHVEFFACSLRTCNDLLHLARLVFSVRSRLRMVLVPSVWYVFGFLEAGALWVWNHCFWTVKIMWSLGWLDRWYCGSTAIHHTA